MLAGHVNLCSQAELSAVVVPRVTASSSSSLHRVGAAEALLALAPTSFFIVPGEEGTRLRRISGWLRRQPCWRLELGSDRERIPALLEQLL